MSFRTIRVVLDFADDYSEEQIEECAQQIAARVRSYARAESEWTAEGYCNSPPIKAYTKLLPGY